jgi:hypothetical protein
MAISTVDISENTHELLRELAEKTGQSTSVVLDKALDAYRRRVFFENLDAGYAEMRGDPQAWEAFCADQKEWDVTLMDGLDAVEKWTADGRAAPLESENIG